MNNKQKKVVSMGGGTGTFPVVTALKSLGADISAVIAVSDSGGSTGRIRDEFGFQPVGDLRQSLAALADKEGQEWIQKILLYRFSKGTGLKGHNLGNLILTALQDMTGNTTESLDIAEKIFNLQGTVIPVTSSNVSLKLHYTDGTTEIGEDILDQENSYPKTIKEVSLTPDCNFNPAAKQAIIDADLVIIGPGDLYGSLMPTLVVDDVIETFAASNAKLLYIGNLMTRRTQTHGMSSKDHLAKIEEVIGKKVDIYLLNNAEIQKNILKTYAEADEFPVKDDLNGDNRIKRADLLLDEVVIKEKNDTAHRSLLRHDPKKLESVFNEILESL